MKQHSDFWMPNYDDWDFIDNLDSDLDIDTSDDLVDIHQFERSRNLIRLSSARRAIANYVNILTGKSLPVLFNDNNISCTDGQTIYIGSDITKKNKFDVSVGLALHESSHVKYTDFDLFKTVWMKVPRSIYDYTEKLNLSKETVGTVCKDILNYIEDRYIDYTVHENAPGYRGYYDALYDEYFNSKCISDALESNLYTTLSVESYMFRIINLTNVSTRLYALPGLYDIAKIIDLTNIKRLTNPSDRLELAFQVAEIVFKNVNDSKNYTQSKFVQDDTSQSDAAGDQQNGNSNGKSTLVEIDGGNDPKPSDKDHNDESSSTSLDDMIGGSETSVTNTQSDTILSDIGQDEKVNKNKLTKIKKAFDKQKDFLNGNLKKRKVTKKDKKLLDILEQSKVEIVNVATDFTQNYGVNTGVECIVVKNMTKELLMSDECPMSDTGDLPSVYKRRQDNIDAGIIMGTKLGRRLQVRNEINTHKFSRRYTGKLDKRLIHELGFSDENIFYTTMTEKYKKINFHITVDASSSMAGNKWDKAIRLSVAIAKAASMLDNVNLTISFRTTSGNNPYILIAYDSKVDKFSKIRNLFSYLKPTGVTPEGLCYEAIMKYLPSQSSDTNSYFVNLSDGEPHFTFESNKAWMMYSGDSAARHTQHQVKKIQYAGYEIISYFISQGSGDEMNKTLFKTMYGENSHFINVENITQIADTLNKKMMDSLDR
jgi:hypothetical protein